MVGALHLPFFVQGRNIGFVRACVQFESAVKYFLVQREFCHNAVIRLAKLRDAFSNGLVDSTIILAFDGCKNLFRFGMAHSPFSSVFEKIIILKTSFFG